MMLRSVSRPLSRDCARRILLPAFTGTATTSARRFESTAAAPPVPAKESVPASIAAEGGEAMQAPNRKGVWARSQKDRATAMTGPRFEQTDFDLQPAPLSAMELVHQQPVKWTHDRIVVCDGGGGPHGHPRIFINTDKPEISWCGYCGLPYANEHHREHLEALPATSYPLS